jgi:tRNA(fMet)-specific endonuclease VapC
MPDEVLVDTDVVSFLFRGDTRAEHYRSHLHGRQVAVSFMTIAELERWARERAWGASRRAALETFLRRFSIYLVDRDLCRRWADITHGARRVGRPIQTARRPDGRCLDRGNRDGVSSTARDTQCG